MRRRLVNVLTGVSLLICAGSLVLVGRSVFRVDVLLVPMGQNELLAGATCRGQLMLGYGPDPGPGKSHYFSSSAVASVSDQFNSISKQLSGIRWPSIRWGTVNGVYCLIIPLWLVPIATGILPMRWWLFRRRARDRGGERGFPVVTTEART